MTPTPALILKVWCLTTRVRVSLVSLFADSFCACSWPKLLEYLFCLTIGRIVHLDETALQFENGKSDSGLVHSAYMRLVQELIETLADTANDDGWFWGNWGNLGLTRNSKDMKFLKELLDEKRISLRPFFADKTSSTGMYCNAWNVIMRRVIIPVQYSETYQFVSIFFSPSRTALLEKAKDAYNNYVKQTETAKKDSEEAKFRKCFMAVVAKAESIKAEIESTKAELENTIESVLGLGSGFPEA